MSSALEEYRERLAQRRARHARLSRTDAHLSYARLITFVIGVALAVMAAMDLVSAWLLVVPVAVFVYLLVRHDRNDRALQAAGRAVTFYERGLARIEDRWIGTGETGDRFRDDAHLYANDLDLFGRGSLFELLSIARTSAGEDVLAAWLTKAAPAAEIRARHAAVQELRSALDLREDVANAGADVRRGVHTDVLVAWAQAPPLLGPPWMRTATALVTLATVTMLAVSVMTDEYAPFFVMLVAQAIFQRRLAARVLQVLHGADGPARELAVLHHILLRLERQPFHAARLIEVQRGLSGEGRKASASIQALERYVEMHDWEHNLIVTPFAALLMASHHLAWAVEAWRRTHGRHIAQWLQAVGEFEALSSLSAYHFEHPGDPFPEFIEEWDAARGATAAMFDGVHLGHPLLPAARMVANDVHLSGSTRMLVVSGSNMSGKSTLLRTVGINAVLALAGAPVRAASLRLSPLVVGATLRIQDSLQEGRSRFFAEITRIREVADVARRGEPLLFLLDELFHGTNSHDRLVGASGVLRNLIDRGAVGLITTHDLALTAVAGELAPRAVNVHFEDTFANGEMTFDYRMKPGPVTHSNAVALMRAVGLEVEDPSTARR